MEKYGTIPITMSMHMMNIMVAPTTRAMRLGSLCWRCVREHDTGSVTERKTTERADDLVEVKSRCWNARVALHPVRDDRYGETVCNQRAHATRERSACSLLERRHKTKR